MTFFILQKVTAKKNYKTCRPIRSRKPKLNACIVSVGSTSVFVSHTNAHWGDIWIRSVAFQNVVAPVLMGPLGSSLGR